MPLNEVSLASEIEAAVNAELSALAIPGAAAPIPTPFKSALFKGIAKAVVAHLRANLQASAAPPQGALTAPPGGGPVTGTLNPGAFT